MFPRKQSAKVAETEDHQCEVCLCYSGLRCGFSCVSLLLLFTRCDSAWFWVICYINLLSNFNLLLWRVKSKKLQKTRNTQTLKIKQRNPTKGPRNPKKTENDIWYIVDKPFKASCLRRFAELSGCCNTQWASRCQTAALENCRFIMMTSREFVLLSFTVSFQCVLVIFIVVWGLLSTCWWFSSGLWMVFVLVWLMFIVLGAAIHVVFLNLFVIFANGIFVCMVEQWTHWYGKTFVVSESLNPTCWNTLLLGNVRCQHDMIWLHGCLVKIELKTNK